VFETDRSKTAEGIAEAEREIVNRPARLDQQSGITHQPFCFRRSPLAGSTGSGTSGTPRVLLMSVPYALKALDAETIGGKPASSFMLAPASSGSSAMGDAVPPGTITGTGTLDFIPRFTGATTIGAESSTEVGENSVSGVEWGICTYVDGSIQGNCVFEGPVPNNDTFVNCFFSNAVSVGEGTHTIQAAVYSSAAGVVLAQYNNTYRLYRP
jgi:hypothetical protein